MRFILFVEGKTEYESLPHFLKKWLDEKLSARVGIDAVNFKGWPNMRKEMAERAKDYLNDPHRSEEIIAVIAIMDLYIPETEGFFPDGVNSVSERLDYATRHFEDEVGDARFRMFFAVHEIEAWLLSDPSIFPREVKNDLKHKVSEPECVNFDTPPKQFLKKLYRQRIKRNYKETADGGDLFTKLDPQKAYEKCPQLKRLLDEMLALAEACH